MNNTGPRGGCLFPLGLMALILAAVLGACAPRAQAQQPVLPGKQICSNASGSTVCSFQPVTDASPLPVSATASIAGFNQETVLTPFTATTSGVTSGSFTAGKVIVVTNAGTTNMAYCRLGASATTSGQPIAPNGGWFAFTTVAETQVTCATSTSTTTINVGVGTGLPTGTGGGGGSGGGGGGAVTVADGADVTQGAIADAAVTAGGTGTLSAKLRYMTTQLDNINTNVQAAIPGCAATPCTTTIGNTQAQGLLQNAERAAGSNGAQATIALDLTGKQIVLPYANPENFLTGLITTAMTGTTDTAVTGMGAQGAGVRNYITGCVISNSHASVGTDVVLKDGSGGSVLWTFPAAANYGGATFPFPTPIKTTANTALYAANITTGASTKVSCTGYKGV